MTSRSRGWFAAGAVTLITIALAVLDVTDRSLRHWLEDHPFTTAVLSGILVLLVTVLVVDRVVDIRRVSERSQAVAAQAAIVLSQASPAQRAVLASLSGDGDRESAGDELRTYLTMLLISAPVLIDARRSRTFLEEAQTLAGHLARALNDHAASDELREQMTETIKRLRAASAPLLASSAVTAGDAGDSDG